MRVKLIVVSLFLASCSGISAPKLPSITPYKIEIRQGNLVTPEMREKIKVGMTTLQVRATLGTPLITDPFHANRWDYQYRYEQEGKLISQQRLTLYFEGDHLARIDEHAMPPQTVASQANSSSKPESVAPAVVEAVAAVPAMVESAPLVAAVNAEPAPVAAQPVAATPARTVAPPDLAEEKTAEYANKAEHKKMVELYRQGAKEGNAEAQFNLGRMYDFGYGVPQNFEVAAEWYRKAAAQGYAKAFFNLGVMNDQGRGVKKDEKKAAERYRAAAELGDEKAQYALGMMYAKGRGVPQNDEMARSWHSKAAAQMNAEAAGAVKTQPEPAAEGNAAGTENNAEYKKMVELYRQGAKEGNAEAQFNLGQMYELGYGVPQSYKIASGWYRKAGKQGYTKAFFNLGVMNSLGRGVKKNDKKAAARFREAARLGDAQAQYTLGMMYAKGLGVPKSDKVAMSWYRKAAAQGYAEAEAIVKAEPAPESVPKVAEAKVEPAPAPEAGTAANVTRTASAGTEQAITDAVKSWAAAWSAQDVAQYLASYAVAFKPANGMSRKAWEAQRRDRVARPKSISVELSDITVDEDDKNSVSVSFKQSYSADSYKDVTHKSLDMKKIGDKWLIVSEWTDKIEAVHRVSTPEAEPAANAPHTASAGAEQAIADAVKSWAAAWSSQDVVKYLASYAQTFKPAAGMSRAAWEVQRKERVAKPKSIVVELSGITVRVQGENSARVNFKQNYRTDSHKDVTNKILELEKTGDQWLIVSEQVSKK